MRIDIFLAKNKYFSSRTKAQNAIKSGYVFVNNKLVTNSSLDIDEQSRIYIINQNNYVSRGANKLSYAIKELNFNFKNKIVLDVGSSTGGFTQIALINGAKYVYAVDVGCDQMDKSLANNKKIKLFENTNFRDININLFDKKIDIIIADLSFISLVKLLNKINEVFNYKLELLLLIKPQFELSKEIIKKNKGIIKNEKYWKIAINKIVNYAKSIGFKVINLIKSKILGKDGNTEFFIHLSK